MSNFNVYLSRGNPVRKAVFGEALKWMREHISYLKVNYHDKEGNYQPNKLKNASALVVLLDPESNYATHLGKGVESEINQALGANKPIYLLYKTISYGKWQLYNYGKHERAGDYYYDKYTCTIAVSFGTNCTSDLFSLWRDNAADTFDKTAITERLQKLKEIPSTDMLKDAIRVDEIYHNSNSILTRKR